MSGQPPRASGYRERNTTADRTMDILMLFSHARPVISGAELAEELGIARSTAYRYLQSLVGSRFLEEAPGGGFRLGLRLLELASVARRSYGLTEIALPVMQDLATQVSATTVLTRRTGELVVCVDRVEASNGPVRISYERGSTLPLNAGASALVLLAWSPPEEVRALLESVELRRFTPRTLVDVDDLMTRLEDINRAGYALSRAELDDGIVGIAAPIQDDAGQVTAAISLALLAYRTTRTDETQAIEHLRRAATTISERLIIAAG